MAHEPLIEVKDLVVRFLVGSGLKRRYIVPVNHVSFTINSGEVVALVGESGSGKTTIGRALVRILAPSSGTVRLAGVDVTKIKGKALVAYRKQIQMIFQDPYGSLNPVKTVERHMRLPIRKHMQDREGTKGTIGEQIDESLRTVGLAPVSEMRLKFPHELSGGQRQRVAIARALAVKPRVLVADEPISMLDVSIRAEILQLLKHLQRQYSLAYLYITHDLASARYFGDRIMVMYGGQIMESAPADELVEQPRHPYTRLLLAATPGTAHTGPLPETSNRSPNLSENRQGCPFADRCPYVMEICRTQDPPLIEQSANHLVACHL